MTNFESENLSAAIGCLGMNRDVPVANIGKQVEGYPANAWTGHVGGLSISRVTSVERHIQLALEHLVAAQTIPTLVAAYEAHLEAEDQAFFVAPEALAALDLYNGYCETDAPSWEVVFEDNSVTTSGRRGYVQEFYLKWLGWLDSEDVLAALDYHNSKKSKKNRLKSWKGESYNAINQWVGAYRTDLDERLAAATAETTYRDRRREELAASFNKTDRGYLASPASTRAAIDHIIAEAISKGEHL